MVDHTLDRKDLHAKYHNDTTGTPSYEPGLLLKFVLLAYSCGIISSQRIERSAASVAKVSDCPFLSRCSAGSQ